MVYWASPTARLLARYLAGRSGGPLFLTTGRSRNPTSRRDVYAPTGQARLSYRTAAALFGRHSGGWTLHQLRHSSLTHLAEGGRVGGDVAGQEPPPGPAHLSGFTPGPVPKPSPGSPTTSSTGPDGSPGSGLVERRTRWGVGRTTLSGRRSRVWGFLAGALGVV